MENIIQFFSENWILITVIASALWITLKVIEKKKGVKKNGRNNRSNNSNNGSNSENSI